MRPASRAPFTDPDETGDRSVLKSPAPPTRLAAQGGGVDDQVHYHDVAHARAGRARRVRHRHHPWPGGAGHRPGEQSSASSEPLGLGQVGVGAEGLSPPVRPPESGALGHVSGRLRDRPTPVTGPSDSLPTGHRPGPAGPVGDPARRPPAVPHRSHGRGPRRRPGQGRRALNRRSGGGTRWTRRTARSAAAPTCPTPPWPPNTSSPRNPGGGATAPRRS